MALKSLPLYQWRKPFFCPNHGNHWSLSDPIVLPFQDINGIMQYVIFFFKFYYYLFSYLFLTVLGLRFCARAFSNCGKQGPLFIAVRGPLTVVASLVAEHRLQTRRLSNCGSRAQPLHSMWDLPRPGLEPMSPALAGRLSTTAPPGKPCNLFLN